MIFYPSENQINSPTLNPAFLTSQSKFTFGIFPLSGMDIGYNNQLTINNILANIISGTQTNDDFRKVFNSMIKLDLFCQQMENNLINFGYNSSIGSFDFRVRENTRIMADIKGDFSEFLTDNSSLSITMNNQQIFPALALHYREYSVGFAREFAKEKLSVGVRAKVYFGKASMTSDVSGIVVQKGQDTYYLQTHDRLRLSAPVLVVTDTDSILHSITTNDNFTIGNYLMNPKNIGFGFDIGLKYNLTPDLVLSASVLDVGSIKWKNNLNTLIFNGEYQFPKDFIVTNENGVLTRNQDFTSEDINFEELYKIKVDESPYSTRLPVTFFAGLKYRLNRKLNVSVVDRFISAQSMKLNSFSVTGVYDIKKNLSISSGYSILGKSYFNMPFAILYTGEAGQYYIGTDNLLSLILPSTAEFSGITFGMCFFLFKSKTRYKDQPEYLPFYKEKKRHSVN